MMHIGKFQVLVGGQVMRIPGILIAAAVAVAAAPSQAAIIVATYYGNVVAGFDPNNRFGAGPELDGLDLEFKLEFVFDSEIGTPSTSPGYAALQGNDLFGTNPFLSVMGTVNGVTVDLRRPGQFGEVIQANEFCVTGYGCVDQVGHDIGAAGATISNEYADFPGGVNDSLDFVDSTDYTDPLDFFVPLGHRAEGGFSANYITDDGDEHYYFINARLNRVTIAALDTVPVVPEPATWSLLILGFGAIGASMRMSRQVRMAVA